MSTSIQQSVNWALSFLNYSTPNVGPNNEPVITSANIVQQIVLSPPFKWPWNRNKANFPITSANQDYTQSLSDFGWLELAAVKNTATSKILQLNVLNNSPLGESTDTQQPVTISAQDVTPATTVTFRFLGLPDTNYTAYVTYQKIVTTISNMGDNWSIPDYLAYIFNQGLLAFLFESAGDTRYQQQKVAFAAALLSNAEGLSESEKNIFMSQFLSNPRMLESTQLKTQQGVQARGQ